MASKISIIVPTYQRGPWFQQCLDSIHAQTYKDIEIIVIDDPKGTGAAAARNRGLDLATGEFVMFCDDDDFLESNSVEKLVNAMAGVDMVIGSFRKVGLWTDTVQHVTEAMAPYQVAEYVLGNLENPRTNQMLSGCWAKLYRRTAVPKFLDLTTAEDMTFNFDYLGNCEYVRFISDIVYNNRKREGSLTTTFDENNKMGLFGFMHGLRHVATFLERYYPDDVLQPALDNSKLYHSLLYFSRICSQSGGTPREVFMRIFP